MTYTRATPPVVPHTAIVGSLWKEDSENLSVVFLLISASIDETEERNTFLLGKTKYSF